MTLSRTGDTSGISQVTVGLNGGTATAGSDFDDTGFPLIVTFAPNETVKSALIPVFADQLDESTETIALTVSTATGATLGTQVTATLNLENRPPLNGGGDVTIPTAGEVDVISDGNDVVVRQGATELLRTPGSQLERLRITGTPGDDTYNIANLAAVFAGLVGGDAGAGYDRLRLTGSGQTLDLTAIPDADLQGIEVIDIAGSGDNSLKLDVDEVLNLSSTTNTLRVLYDEGDVVSYGAGWKVELPQIIDSQFVRTLRRIKSDATDEDATVEVVNTFAFQNPYLPLDVNHDGTVAPIDALIIINRLNDTGPGALGTPTSVVGLTEFFYFDTNGDRAVAPIDVLVVINHLNDPRRNAEGESAGARSIPDFIVPSSGPSPASPMTQERRQNVLPVSPQSVSPQSVSPQSVSPQSVSPQSVSITVRPSTASDVSRSVSERPLRDDPTSLTEEEDLHNAMEDIFAAWPDERSGLFDTP